MVHSLRTWRAWTREDLPDGVPPYTMWLGEVRQVAHNGRFSVLIRPLPDGAIHAMVTKKAGAPSWAEMQRIKDSLFGADRWAVECFPPRRKLVDGADSYHLWVLPEGAAWPYDLASTEPVLAP